MQLVQTEEPNTVFFLNQVQSLLEHDPPYHIPRRSVLLRVPRSYKTQGETHQVCQLMVHVCQLM